MSPPKQPRPRVTVHRFLAVVLLPLLFFLAYFPFASVVARRIWGQGQAGIFSGALLVMGVLLLLGILLRPKTSSGWITFWLCVVSSAASLLGVVCLALPQHGHPSIGIFFFITPVTVNAVLIPAVLLSLAVSLIRGEKTTFIAIEFAWLLVASFIFSHLRSNIPAALDFVSGGKYFSKMVRRLDIACPDSSEMTEDPFLIRRCSLSFEKMAQLENVAGASPQHCCAVVGETLDRFSSVPDFELRRRLLGMIFRLCPDLNLDNRCRRDLVSFLFEVMKQKDADVSDIAAGLLATRTDSLFRSGRYQPCMEALARYALERQTNPPRELGSPGSGKFYYQRTFDCTRELNNVATNLLANAESRVPDQQVAAGLLLFLPYLKARQSDQTEANWQFNQRFCGELASRIERLNRK